ncbi:lipopolysaccharide assembly protein LapB [Comamonas endophytica]|uniref:Lipopolysaccharide assembly protein B n=1 Tax=Comamonas endophytica TaxID=2949090 RepID=A0ABY6GA86_9BURK|nr:MULTISPECIES: lipopolysaccharide assembly protein LapB [unclassified Acidovorax]MCD2514152.1 lipopolysaccharide assembly protein LapB [Acidovorax sp. D4N7]UYG51292.1 lipopolysaccharide assembly protein LapB [Acidovorax sp. 5MLIR]
MEFDLSWILLGFPLAFVLGWLASRFDARQMRAESRSAPKAYFKGLNFLLNEQQDKAIDAFIEAVQNDPDTSELHFALGNLFRRRGEYNRAVRVHEHLLSRGDLSRPDRDRAQHALALDFLKAGLLDRAEDALRRLEGTSFEAEARLALLAIYERSRDWKQASDIAHRMQTARQGDFSVRLAHYLCEGADVLAATGKLEEAVAQYQQALVLAPSAGRPQVDLARLQHRLGHSEQAWSTLQGMAEKSPGALPLAAALLPELAQVLGDAQIRPWLEAQYERLPSLDLLQALVALDAAHPGAPGRERYVAHLDKEPSLVAATRWLADEPFAQEQHHPALQRALEHASKPLTRYRCAACGFEARQHFWHCPGCQSWDSYPARRVEEL